MIKVFFSYSHKDEELRDELEAHLSPLKKTNIIETWHDRIIDAGEEFNHEIDSNLADSNIVLLLISSNFLNSEYCYDVEMKEAFSMHQSDIASVIPIILHPCDWKITPLGKLNACPTDGKAISTYSNRHEAYVDVAKSIRRVSESIMNKPSKKSDEQKNLHTQRKEDLVESKDLDVKLEKIKTLYPSNHKSLIEWLINNKKSHTNKIYEHIRTERDLLDLGYDVPTSSHEIKKFNREISQFIDLFEGCLRTEDTEFIDEPEYGIQYNKNIYKSAFYYLLNRVPIAVKEESKGKFKIYIDYLLSRI